MTENYGREAIYALIDGERERQQKLGKQDNHAWVVWLTIFMDYSGRVANQLWFLLTQKEETAEALVEALVKVLAVGVAWMENILNFKHFLEATDGEQEESEGE